MTIEFERGKAYIVDRGQPRLRIGQGLLAGLDVVIHHFRDAFLKKLDNPSQTSGVFTIEYPEERMKLPEAYRNFPILLYDDTTGQELCTSCFQCERICPPQVIHMTQAKDPVTGKPVPAVAEFLLEYDACMSCGLCAEVCPFDAIKMDHEYELSTDVHGGLTINKAGLDRPISYYEKIAPTFWAEVKDSALKKLQTNTKRRSGPIGIAPSKLKEHPELLTPVAPLAAIRAANAAKVASTAPSVDATAPVASAAPSVDEKAAKLAAIRAANAAKVASTAPSVDATAPSVDAAAPSVDAAAPDGSDNTNNG